MTDDKKSMIYSVDTTANDSVRDGWINTEREGKEWMDRTTTRYEKCRGCIDVRF